MNRTAAPGERKMGLLQAVSLAVGTMIGASIFSIFAGGGGLSFLGLFVALGVFLLLLRYQWRTAPEALWTTADPAGQPAGGRDLFPAHPPSVAPPPRGPLTVRGGAVILEA